MLSCRTLLHQAEAVFSSRTLLHQAEAVFSRRTLLHQAEAKRMLKSSRQTHNPQLQRAIYNFTKENNYL